ncbi:ROK family protein [Patescibacteria group bacterium]
MPNLGTKKNKLTIGIDIGGTKIAAGLVTSRGQLSDLNIRRTPRSTRGIINALYKIIASYPAGLAVGVGVAGQVLPKEGLGTYSPNFPSDWKNVPLKKIISLKHRVPVAINNDAKCFAIAENKYGAGKKFTNYVSLTWGTGIGGSIIINKKIFSGKHNTAGEFGHTILSYTKSNTAGKKAPRAEDGAAGKAMSKFYKKISGRTINNKEVIRLWRRGDNQATRAVENMANNFGLVMVSVANTINPEAIIVGGGLSYVRGLLEIAKKTFKINVYAPQIGSIPIIRAKLGEYANIVGAAYMVNNRDY